MSDPSPFPERKFQELTQPDPANRTKVGDAATALQTLAQCVIEGDFNHFKQLVKLQLATATDAARRTVLMLVADIRKTPMQAEKCILYLFKLGASPKAANDQGDTAAHLAARRDNVRVLALLAFDAKWLRNNQGLTPLMEAARTGSWKSAKHLLHLLRQERFNECGKYGNSKRLELLGLKDASGRTALELARQSGHSELASYIEREMRLVVARNGEISGLTAQEEADRQELLRLAEAGDSVGLWRAATRTTCDLPDKWGLTALMWAAVHSQCGDEALWEQLLQLGDPTCANMLGLSCLHGAAGSGNSAAASALLDAGASVNATSGTSESTPLMSAAVVNAAAVSRVLLDAGADWSLKDSQGRTALDLATHLGKSELAELLRGYEGKKFFDAPLARPPYRPGNPPFRENWDEVELIGRGYYADVHEVLTDKGIKCAAKTLRLPKQLGDQPDSAKQKAIEKVDEGERNLCQLKHQNIVRFFYIHKEPEAAKIVVFMELLDGISLENFIKKSKKPMDEDNIRSFAEQICSALLYMHSREPAVIHRDINCSNIIVLKDGKRLKLVDFGLSIKLEQAVSHITGSTDGAKGTLCFLAPELLGEGESEKIPYSRESDIWAFGCTVYQMASGSRPFEKAQSRKELREQILKKKGGPPLPDGYSAVLRKFYKCCTAMDRKKRKSADELMRHEFLVEKLRGQAS